MAIFLTSQRSALLRIARVVSFSVLLFSAQELFALQDGLARTPPMGFNTWNYFKCNKNRETVILRMATAMVRKHAANWEGKEISLLDAGYQYVNLDDCWQGERDSTGFPGVDTAKFPHGMKWLADSVHALGLKIGIYSCAGTLTCAGKFAAYNEEGGYDSIDAAAYAAWGIDYLKHDWCNIDKEQYDNTEGSILLYSRMRDALKKSGRDIVFSLCNWGNYLVPQWGDTVGHLWRTSGDIDTTWGSILKSAYTNISGYGGGQRYWEYQRPGAWNDADMMQLGNGFLTIHENKAHMDLWCIMATPMLLGNDLDKMSDTLFDIVTNREVIEVNQDSLGIQGHRITSVNDPIQVWVKTLSSPDTVNERRCAVLVINNGSTPASGTVQWSQFGEKDRLSTYTIRDLWKHEEIAVDVTDSFTVADIPSHGSVHMIFTRTGVAKVWNGSREITTHAAQLVTRTTAAGFQLFIPEPGCRVALCNQLGRQTAAFTSAAASWHTVTGPANRHQVSIVRITRTNGKIITGTLVPLER